MKPWRLVVSVAVITALVISIGVSGVWFALRAAAPDDGSLDALRAASDGGQWHAQGEPSALGVELAGDSLSLSGFPSEEASWLVQITLHAGDEAAAVRAPGDGGLAVLRADAGETTSTSFLVRRSDDGGVDLAVTGDAEIEAQALVAFSDSPGETPRPGPGGSIAIAPQPLIDTEVSLGLASTEEPGSLSPLGLGEIPSGGVAAVWLQVLSEGGSVAVGDETARQPVGRASLTLAALDSDGRVWIEPDEGVTRVRASVVGWVASADPTVDRAVIDRGILSATTPLDPATSEQGSAAVDVPSFVPAGATALFRVDQPSGDGVLGGGAGDGYESRADVAGAASAVIAARVGGDSADVDAPDGARVQLLGYVTDSSAAAEDSSGGPERTGADAGENGDAEGTEGGDRGDDGDAEGSDGGDGSDASPSDPDDASDPDGGAPGEGGVPDGAAPSIAVETPAQDDAVDLVEGGGEFTISGTVEGGAGGVRSVWLTRGDRQVGAADLFTTPEGDMGWRLTTSAPIGRHDVVAHAVDGAGAEASDEVSFEVAAPDEAEPIITPETVPLRGEAAEAVSVVDGTTMSVDPSLDLRVGDIVVADATADNPDGVLRRVTSLARQGDEVMAGTEMATLTEVFLAVEIDTSDAQATAVPAAADGGTDDAAIRPVMHTGGGLQQTAANDEDSIELGRLEVEVSSSATIDDADSEIETSAKIGNGDASISQTFSTVPENVSTEVDFGENLPNITRGETPDPTASPTPEAPSPTPDASTASPHPSDEGEETRPERISVSGKTTVSGKVAYTEAYSLRFELKIRSVFSWFSGEGLLEKLELAVTKKVTKSEDYNLSGEVSVQTGNVLDWKKKGASQAADDENEVRVGGATFLVGPVPVWISFYADTSLSFDLTVTGELALSHQEERTETVGFRWQDGALTDLGESRFDVTPSAKASVTGALSATAEVGLDTRLYEVVGATIGGKLKPSVTMTATTEKPGIYLEIRARMDISVVFAFEAWNKITELVGDEDLELEYELSWKLFDRQLYEHTFFDDGTEDSGDPPGEPDDIADGDGDRPLVLIADTSGSMSGDRIEEAKSTLNSIVQEQVEGSELGIWTYPGASGCQAGGYQVPVQPMTGRGALLETIDNLSTNGATPTAEALRAVTDDLQQRGYTGATLVLVTDGQSTCDPPCTVAQEIVDSGFDLSVQGVAYQLDESDRQELSCIADATEGQVHVVEDDEDLWPLIEEISQASLEVSIAAADQVERGRSLTVELTVENPGARDVTGASVVVDAGEAAVQPASKITLGNIPAGGTVTRSVTVDTSEAPSGDGLEVEAQTWAENVAMVSQSHAIAVTDAPVESAPGEVLTGGAEDPVIAALGDAPVAGAATEDRLTGETSGAVLMTGAEQTGYDTLLDTCAVEECDPSGADAQNVLRATQLLDVSHEISEAAAELRRSVGRDDATLVVAAYPRPYPTGRGDVCGGVSPDEAALLDSATVFLNTSIERSVERASDDGAAVVFTRASETALLSEGRACADDAESAESDDARVAEAIAAWSAGQSSVEAEQDPAPHGFAAPGSVDIRIDADARHAELGSIASPAVQTNQRVAVSGTGFDAGTSVTVRLAGDGGASLGSARVDADGAYVIEASIPAGMPIGARYIEVLGVVDGESTTADVPIVIEQAPPVWVWLLAISGALLIAAAVVLVIVAIVRIRRGRVSGGRS